MSTKTHAAWVHVITAAVALALIAGCGGSWDAPSFNDTNDGGVGEAGTMRVLLTDAPAADLQEVWVNIAAIELVSGDDDGEIITLDAGVLPNLTGPVDLLSLSGTTLELGEADVPVGEYEQIRLLLHADGNRLVLPDSTEHVLTVPSGTESGIKVNLSENELEIVAGSTTTLLLDFLAAPSVHKAGQSGMWILRPVVNAVTPEDDDEEDLGQVEGTLSDTAGEPVAEVDGDPVAVILQNADSRQFAHVDDDDGEFEIPSVLPGQYQLSVGRVDQEGLLVGSPFPIVIDSQGQTAASVRVTVNPDEDVEMDITVDMTEVR